MNFSSGSLSDIESSFRVGVDIGGTFTDFVGIHPGTPEILTLKVLSTPTNPEQAVLSGIERLLEIIGQRGLARDIPLTIIHGSTVATNALLERKGAPTALVTTKGFRDVLQIGRQNRPELYDLLAPPQLPLIPEAFRFEIEERVDSSGQIIRRLDSNSLENLVVEIETAEVSSVAVCLLFSFLRPDHEHEIGRRLRPAGYFVSLSSEISPEYREFERMSTTAINAYVSPILDRYLLALEALIGEVDSRAHLRVMQSNGGQISISEARRAGVRCVFSGPAGGVIGSMLVANRAAENLDSQAFQGVQEPTTDRSVRIITFDMGGTSTDVSLIDRKPGFTTEAKIGGYPIQIPMLDIHTIGAGGGSIAYIDPGLALRVGPASAGADPGPACYGLGDPATIRPTVTDANLVLGRLPADYFLGGEITLDYTAAMKALQSLADRLGSGVIDVALGIIDVVNAHMERALRVISVERGYDPAEFTLASFGGAGGLHAAQLARQLGIARVLISPLASTLSAFGMVAADVVKNYSRTVMLPGSIERDVLRNALRPLLDAGQLDLEQEGVSSDRVILEPALDMRYRGQSYELTVPYEGDFTTSFHQMHAKRYGYSRVEAPTEIVTLRVRATGRTSPPRQSVLAESDPDATSAILDRRTVYLSKQSQTVPFFLGNRLLPGNCIEGPAIIVRPDTTVLLQPEDLAQVDPYQNLVITLKNES
jgi:N-methylhydantoinase A